MRKRGWLREAEPYIMCLQELKATDTEFPAEVGVKLLIEASLNRLENASHPIVTSNSEARSAGHRHTRWQTRFRTASTRSRSSRPTRWDDVEGPTAET